MIPQESTVEELVVNGSRPGVRSFVNLNVFHREVQHVHSQDNKEAFGAVRKRSWRLGGLEKKGDDEDDLQHELKFEGRTKEKW